MSEEDPIVVGQETILEGTLPEQAVNSGSLAEFAAKTQQDWEDELRGNEVTRWEGGVLDGLYTGLQQGQPFVVALIRAIIDKVFEDEYGDPDGPIENAAEALTALKDRFKSKWDDLRAANETAGTALDDAAAAATAAEDAEKLAALVIESGSNIIKNPSFEQLIFQQAGSSFSTDYARTGTRSLRLVGDGSNIKSYTLLSDDAVPRNVTVNEGDWFYLEFYVRGHADNNQNSGGEDAISLLFEPFSGNNQPLPPLAKKITASTALNSGWTKFDGFVQMPPLARTLRMQIQLSDDVANNQKWYFDDVVVREVTLAKNAKDAADEAERLAGLAGDLANEIIASGSNVIINPGFENTRFEQAGSSFSTEFAHFGVRSLRLEGNATSAVSYTLLSEGLTPRTISVSEGDVFYGEVFVRGHPNNSQTSGGANAVRMVFEPLNKNGAVIAESVKTISKTASTAINGDWVKMADYAIMPAGAAQLRIRLELSSGVDADELYFFDDVVVREVTLAYTSLLRVTAVDDLTLEVATMGSNILVNPGFENGYFLPGAGSYSTEEARTGDRSLKLVGNGLTQRKFTFMSDDSTGKFIPVSAGDVFYAEIWVKAGASTTQTSGGINGIQFVFEPYNNLTPLTEINSISISPTAALKSDWVKLSGYTDPMPDAANRMKVSIRLENSILNNQAFFFDDAVVREVTLAKEAQLSADLALQNATDAAGIGQDIIGSGSNLIVNSDFERGLPSQPLVGTFSTDQKYSGTRSLRLIANGNIRTYYLLSEGLTPKTVPVSPGDWFECSFWVYASGIPAGTDVDGGLRLVFEPTNRFGGNLVDSYVGLRVTTALNGTWTEVKAYAQMPPEAVKAKVAVQLRNTVSSGTFYIDQVIVREVTVAKNANDNAGEALLNFESATEFSLEIINSGSNLIVNPNFEKGFFAQLGSSYSSDVAYSGTKSLKMVSNGSAKTYMLLSDGITPATIPAAAGDVLFCEMWVYGANGTVPGVAANTQTSGGATGIRLVIEPLTRTNAPLAASFISQTASTALNGTWTRMAGYLTLPPNTAKFKASIQFTSVVASGSTYYFDQVIIREVTVGKKAQDNLDTKGRDLTNLAGGSDFEGANQPWDLGTRWTIATDHKYAGTQSLKRIGSNVILSADEEAIVGTLPAGASSSSTLQGTFAALPDEQFRIEFYARRNTAMTETTTEKLRLINQAGTEIAALGFGANVVTSANTWTAMADTITIPAGTTSFTVLVSSSTVNGSLWLDNIVIRRVVTVETLAALPQSKVTGLDTSLTGINDTAVSASDLAAMVGASNNLVISPDFEDPTVRRFIEQSISGLATGSYSTDRAVTGTYSYKITLNSAGSSGSVAQLVLNPYKTDFDVVWFNIVPGQVYKYDLVYYLTGTSSKPLSFRAGYRMLNSTTGTVANIAEITPVKNSWQRVTGTFTVPDLVPAVTGSPPLQMVVTVGFSSGAVGAVGDTLYIDRCLVYL